MIDNYSERNERRNGVANQRRKRRKASQSVSMNILLASHSSQTLRSRVAMRRYCLRRSIEN
jgi:hypothetical protein